MMTQSRLPMRFMKASVVGLLILSGSAPIERAKRNPFDEAPDRLVLLPKGRMAFIELKAPGKKTKNFTEKTNETVISFRVFPLCS